MRSTTILPRREAERAATRALAASLARSAEQGSAVFGVCGGRSVGGILSELADRTEIPWPRIHVFLVDERLVPLSDSESNFRLIEERLVAPLLQRDAMPADNVHPFRMSDAPDQGIAAYAQELGELGGRFDVVLLSAGEDGHVAALFPGHPCLDSDADFVTLEDSPKPPSARMTCTLSLLARSGAGFLLVFGEAKRQALTRFHERPIDLGSCPAQVVLRMPESQLFTDQELP